VLIQLVDKQKFFGFKFVLPILYPYEPPLTYLDEPENPILLSYIDYLEKGNKIVC